MSGAEDTSLLLGAIDLGRARHRASRAPAGPGRVQDDSLLLRALDLAGTTEPGRFIELALDLFLRLTGAELGYVGLSLDHELEKPDFEVVRGIDEAACARARDLVSHGIIAEALARGETIQTVDAVGDERFQDLPSVRRGEIGAVLCVPIGTPPLGFLYLQSHASRGPFPSTIEAQAQLLSARLVPAAQRVVEHVSRERSTDPTALVRSRMNLEGLVGRSDALARVLCQLELLARVDVDVLIVGATGTGKSQVARAIAANGPRASRPFVDVNCAAIPEALFESELFGARRGAHSTAFRDQPGRVAAAEGGTLFLDEIGELAPASQAKLLGLLQTRTYQALGASAPTRADIRVMCATNVDLELAVRERRFREDLYYRIAVMPVALPALAERREDIPLLARHFCAAFSTKHRLGTQVLSPEALHHCAVRDWPGNVRQLAHAIEAGVLRAAGDGRREVGASDLFPAESVAGAEGTTLVEATRRFQASFVAQVLDEEDWNISKTARRIDVSRSHLYTLIHEHRLRRA